MEVAAVAFVSFIPNGSGGAWGAGQPKRTLLQIAYRQ